MSDVNPAAGAGSTEAESERFTSILTEQLERRSYPEARETVAILLRLKPGDKDALDIQEMLDDQMEAVTSGQVGQIRRFRGHKTWVNSVAFSPDGRRALSGSGGAFVDGEFKDGDDRSLVLWDVDSGRKLFRFRGHKTVINCVAFSPDGRRLLSGGRGGSICLWDGAFLMVIRHFQRRGRAVWGLAFSPDGRQFLSGGDDRVVRLWNVRTGANVRCFEGHSNGVNCVAFSPDGRHALSGSFDNSVRLWDVESGRQLRCFDGHTRAVLSVAFTPDGSQALSASMDRSIRVWNLDNGSEVRRLAGHTQRVNSVTVAPEGRLVLSGSADNTLRLWDLTTGRELRRFQGHTDSVLSVTFAPDGRHALSGSRDRTLRLWQLPSILDVLNPNEWAFNLVEALNQSGILAKTQLDELTNQLQARFTESRALAWHLLERGWVTTYQVTQLVLGRLNNLKLGSYIILDRLGEGGMGQVFKGRDPCTGKIAALKVARNEALKTPEDIKQFWWESEVVGRLSHANVVKTFGSGQDEDKRFFAMEYIEGTDLETTSRQGGPLPVAQACDYIRQAALALQHAHEHYLIHRDIKPANLLRAQALGSSSAGVIKVIDWGLADLRHQRDAAEQGSPIPKGEMVGTIDFMAPEQAADPRAADIRADIYSLGCSFYQLLTGRPPFPGGTLMQKLVKHQQLHPTPVESLRADIPTALPAILHKMLAKKPEDRYQTPGEVAEVLAPFTETETPGEPAA